MKKYLFICIALLFVIACNDRHLQYENPIWDVSKQTEAFHKLSIVSLGAVSPTFTEQEYVVDAEKKLTIYVSLFEESTATIQCTGSAELSDQDYNKLMNLINIANLFEYEPPQASDPECLNSVGSSGYLITYMRNDDTYHEIHSACKMNIKIHDLIDTVSDMASTYIQDCTEEGLINGPFTEVEGEGGEPIEDPENQFCGISTYGTCQNSDDCKTTGCSQEICYSDNEDYIPLPCMTGPCTDASAYNMTCTCHDNKCQWM